MEMLYKKEGVFNVFKRSKMSKNVFKAIKSKLSVIPVHPTFILLFLWFVLTKNFIGFLSFVLVVLMHEYGHYFVAKKLGYKLDGFFIAPYGVSLNYSEKAFDSKDELLIALAGPCVNFFISLVLVTLWWIVPDIYNFTSEVVVQSVMLGLFNLLPCYPLDGGRVFASLLQNSLSRERAVKLTVKFNYFFSFILLSLFFVSLFIDFNPTLCLCGCFLVLGIIDSKFECRYQPVNIFKKRTKDFSKPVFIAVNCEVTLCELLKHIEVNKYTIFVVVLKNGNSLHLDEGKVKKLSMNYPLNAKLCDLFKNQN